MAGEVPVEAFVNRMPGGWHRIDLIARECPVTKAFGEICCSYDKHSGCVAVCPFWYGLQTWPGIEEARSIGEARAWLGTDELGKTRHYTVRCLRKESAGVRQGARLRV